MAEGLKALSPPKGKRREGEGGAARSRRIASPVA